MQDPDLTDRLAEPIIIDMQTPTAQCCICGRWDVSRWGVPVSTDTCLIIANDSDEDWCAKPVCRSCHEKHAAGEFVGLEPKY